MQQLEYSHSDVRILVLSSYADYYQNRDMMATSATKYMQKQDASLLLIDVVHELAKGESLQLSH
jgi:DNA-binding NarL/FixJ family response regulator